MTHKLFGRMLAVESFGADLRQAIGQICKAPAFSASVVLLLAAGFGISVAVFGSQSGDSIPIAANSTDRFLHGMSDLPSGVADRKHPKEANSRHEKPNVEYMFSIPIICSLGASACFD
jgi:hypothetical protein